MKPILYAANTSSTAVGVGDTIPFGTAIRRIGNSIDINGTGISVKGSGWYDFSASVTATLTSAGTVTVSLYKDGVAVPGVEATVTGAAADEVNLSLIGIFKNSCCNSSSTLSLVVSGTAVTTNNVASKVEKK